MRARQQAHDVKFYQKVGSSSVVCVSVPEEWAASEPGKMQHSRACLPWVLFSFMNRSKETIVVQSSIQ